MTRWIKTKVARTRFLPLLGLLALTALIVDNVHAGSVAQVMEKKTLPQATIDVIDPETGTSSGSGGAFGVRVDVGDIILFKFAFTPAPYQELRGIQTYLTEYIPPNTRVVGVRIMDEAGHTITPRYPGFSDAGCTGASCPTFVDLPCSSGTGCTGGKVTLQRGSIAQLHADTGIFYAPTSATTLTRTPLDEFITLGNGIEMTTDPVYVASIVNLLDAGDSIYSHNAWDWTQVKAYGISTAASGNKGKGETPFGYGSPVAGPESLYQYEASEVGGVVQFNGVQGPWHRIRYPGAKIGTGSANPPDIEPTTLLTYARVLRDPVGGEIGWDATPANPVSAKALRWALGDSRIGVPQFVEVALEVMALPLDPNFGGGPGEHVNCGEVVGTNIATRRTGSVTRGEENPWSAYLASPSCVYLRLLLDVAGETDLAVLRNVSYTLRTKNLSVNDETGVVVQARWNDTEMNYISTDTGPAPDGPVSVCADDSSKMCLSWTVGTLAPSDEFNLATTFYAKNNPGTGVLNVRYYSDQLPAPGYYSTRDVYVQEPVAVPVLALTTVADPTVTAAIPNGTYAVTGSLTNTGNYEGTFLEVNPRLPANWSLVGNQLSVGGATVTCNVASPNSPSRPRCAYSQKFPIGATPAVTFSVNVPGTATTGLYDLDLQIWLDEVETYFDHAATIPVGQVRTTKPVLDCPIGSTATSVTGSSEPDAYVLLYFNLMARGEDTADGAGEWAVTSYDAFGPFGAMYGGLEVTATAQAPGKLVSEYADRCDVTPKKECSDGIDNDGDGLIDYPEDPGCDSPSDNSEGNDPQCSDGVDNDSANGTDWPIDPSCYGPDDPTEDGVPACSDGIDNDLDGDIDFPADTDCDSASDSDEATLRMCQNRINDDAAGTPPGSLLTDFDIDPDHYATSDPGCHSPFDDEEWPVGFTPEDVYGRILVVFDTSGSMNLNTCTDDFTGGDGSEDFPGDDVDCADLPIECAGTPAADSLCGNGLADDSRLYQVKAGLTNVFNSFGEVEYGLMRFHQRGVEFQPPTVAGSLASGGWQGAGAICGSFAGGDVVVAFSPDNPPTLVEWIDGQHDYLGGDPPESLYPPPTLDWELRGTGLTPLAGALGDAQTYLSEVKADDPVELIEPDCRPYRVVLVTDGLETCGGDPAAAAGALFAAGFPVDVIAFSTADPTVKDALDQIAAAGSNDPFREAISASDQAALSAAFAQIITETIRYEICNGFDDDCDGAVDEDFPDKGGVCNNGRQGVCYEEGTIVCDYPPDFPTGDGGSTRCLLPGDAPLPGDLTEVCNGLDDDCNGLVDDGITCTCGGQEICNGLDDDCDGAIDEGECADDGAGDATCNPLDQTTCESTAGCLWVPVPGVGQECGTDIGLCEFGALDCVDPDDNVLTPNSALECVGGTGPGASDPCNGWDDDCDAQVDEDFGSLCYPAATIGCTWNVDHYDCDGICQPGNLQCVDPTPAEPENGDSYEGSCVDYTGPDPELCNGIDDNCDGTIDEDWNPDSAGHSQGDICSNGLLGVCEAFGFWVCNGADPSGPLICTAPTITPGVETCNGLDDDCDGLIDEGDCIDDGAGPGVCEALDQTTCEATTGCLWQNMPPVGNICGGGSGCDNGYFQCVDPDDNPATPNSEIQCVGSSSGNPETCNGIDDDCDELIDEPDPDGIYEIEKGCYPVGVVGCTGDEVPGFEDDFVFNPVCVGECSPGETICVPPDILCVGYQGPADFETCDGRDNNCDGLIDNEAECPSPGDICYEGICIFPCDDTEFPCPFGFYCDTLAPEMCDEPPCRFCLEDQCVGVSCDPGFRCDPETGECEDLCDGVECPAGKTCRGGFCFDCFDATCPSHDYCCDENENCVVGEGGVGVCEEDLCYDVTCQDDQFCREGVCIDLVCDPACEGGLICIDGECVGNLCADVVCAGGKVCNPETGECVGDLCADVHCDVGEACNPGDGECIPDPCLGTDCPSGYHCEVAFSGRATCLEDVVVDDNEWVYVGGGGGCAVGGDGSEPGRPSWLLLIGLGLLGWRRRRR